MENLKIRAGDYFEYSINNKEIEDNYIKNSNFIKFEIVLTNKKGNNITKKYVLNQVVSFSSNETELLEKGNYDLYLLCYKNDLDKIAVKLSQVIVLEGIFSSSISNIEKMVEVIEDVLQKRIKQEYISYTINGRQITKFSPSELVELLKYYKEELYNYKFSQLDEEEKQKRQLRLINLVNHDF